ncbi:hypothetical protein EXIGLDRAFT_139248 [Exidia glandulosa HHB12029]|uniref:Uncharacterized protein n=1 Tax=Exidia glandulosa HHB12029 TaxID=1314781 RepID=A0A165FXJ1_EXIGL|nr:hypothetical protein EXIGLDRAFT_139248 [Exidia glandulosa HHB12029]
MADGDASGSYTPTTPTTGSNNLATVFPDSPLSDVPDSPPPPAKRASESTQDTPRKRQRTTNPTATSSKPDENQRRAILNADPLARNVETNRVFCAECKKWVKLGEGVRYRIKHWAGHCALVHKRDPAEAARMEADALSVHAELGDAASPTDRDGAPTMSATEPSRSRKKSKKKSAPVPQTAAVSPPTPTFMEPQRPAIQPRAEILPLPTPTSAHPGQRRSPVQQRAPSPVLAQRPSVPSAALAHYRRPPSPVLANTQPVAQQQGSYANAHEQPSPVSPLHQHAHAQTSGQVAYGQQTQQRQGSFHPQGSLNHHPQHQPQQQYASQLSGYGSPSVSPTTPYSPQTLSYPQAPAPYASTPPLSVSPAALMLNHPSAGIQAYGQPQQQQYAPGQQQYGQHNSVFVQVQGPQQQQQQYAQAQFSPGQQPYTLAHPSLQFAAFAYQNIPGSELMFGAGGAAGVGVGYPPTPVSAVGSGRYVRSVLLVLLYVSSRPSVFVLVPSLPFPRPVLSQVSIDSHSSPVSSS